MSAPKIRNPEGCRPRTSRISESWHDALVSRQVWVICVESTPSQTCPHYSRKRLYSCAAAHWRFGPRADMIMRRMLPSASEVLATLRSLPRPDRSTN